MRSKFKLWQIKTAVAFRHREKASAFERSLKTASAHPFPIGNPKLFIVGEESEAKGSPKPTVNNFARGVGASHEQLDFFLSAREQKETRGSSKGDKCCG